MSDAGRALSDSASRFEALELRLLSETVLSRASELGCSHAEVRIEQLLTQHVSLRDGRLEGAVDAESLGVGVRVLHSGALGFAATVDLESGSLRNIAEQAVLAAILTGKALAAPVELAQAAGQGDASWFAPYEIDPFAVPLSDKIAFLEALSARLLARPEVDHVVATASFAREDKYYADLSGSRLRQGRVRCFPVLEALALGGEGSDFESMRTLSPPSGRGYEHLVGEAGGTSNFEREIDELPALLAEKLASPSVVPGRYDLLIDPTNLWLTIHESVGHATEADRALGYEAAYAGTSFARPAELGALVYGSPLMTVTGDRTVPNGLATVGYDDEGVPATQFDLVRDGLFVGYQLDRQFAAMLGASASNGCAYADSALHAPMQRMANVSLVSAGPSGPSLADLIAGIEDGIYVVGDKSWSIDMQRYNFQFTGQRFFKIHHGELAGQLRDVAYQATTTEFWRSLVALGGDQTYLLCGATNCGKGQPGQVAPVSHGCPAAVFEGVSVLNARNESGR